MAGDIESGPFTEAEKAALALATVLSNAVQDGVVDEIWKKWFGIDMLYPVGMSAYF